jgi:PAS domain S-box-containing protein
VRLGTRGELSDLAERFNDMARRLEQRRREFIVLGDSSPDAIARISRDLRLDWANAALLERLRMPLEELAGKPMSAVPLEPGVTAAVEHHALEVFASGHRSETEEFVSTSAGDVWLDLRIAPERNAAGEVTHAVVIARDVTARRQLAAHLAQAERLDSIGKLAGNIAHDFNNLLTAIIGNAEIAIRSVEPTERVHADLTKILDISRRASLLTRQLLSFARRQVTAPRVINVNAFLEEATPLLRRVIGEHVALVLQFSAGQPRIRFDPTQLEQVLVNLAANARDAMPGGGRLTIATSLDTVADGSEATDERAPGEYLCLSVADTGAGMSNEIRERIFEPFFSTKEVGKGSGMGLATVHGIVHEHGGHILVDSAPASGATFRVLLPLPAGRPDAVALEQPSQAGASAPQSLLNGRVLVVEDEQTVGEFMADLLETWGLSVIVKPNPEEARALFAAAPESFDLVVTDYTMPKGTGLDLARQLQALRPELPVILYTGYSDAVNEQDAQRCGVRALVRKPIEPAILLAVMREHLPAVERPAEA